MISQGDILLHPFVTVFILVFLVCMQLDEIFIVSKMIDENI